MVGVWEITGGTISELSGGKFSNGAQTAAMGYLFNQARSQTPAEFNRSRNEGLVEVTGPYDPKKKMFVSPAQATELLQMKLMGIDASNPLEVQLFRADSSCVAICVARTFVIGEVRDELVLSKIKEYEKVLRQNKVFKASKVLKSINKISKPVGLVIDMVNFNDTVRECQAGC